MDSLTHLNTFISERLTAAAVEIFGAVEETLLEHQREISRSKQEIDHLRSLALWPEVRLHRSVTHELSHHCCDKGASPENRSRTLSPEQQTALQVKEEHDQSQRGASCRQQCDAPLSPQSVKPGHKDLPSHLYRILPVEQTADVKSEPNSDGFTASPSSRETDMHCGIDAELCGQDTLTDPLEITDREQNWPDEQQDREQDWSACQQHEDPNPTQIKVEKLTSTSSQEETVHEFKPERSFYVEPHFSNHNQTLRNQTFHPIEEERRDVEGEGSNLFRVSQPFYSHYPVPQGVYQESAGGPVNGESFKEHPLSGVMRRRRTNSNLCHKEILSFALEGAVSGLTKERRQTCPICTKRFKESSHLKEHVRIHTGEKPYRCEQCGTNFRQSGALTLHTRIHTGERTYECSGCGRRFNRKGDMECHMVTHTGERPHLCLVCGKSYRRKSNLRMHLKIHAEGQKLHTQPL